MAPEQFKKGEYDAFKADVHALGVTLFNMIFKRLPFQPNSSEDTKANTSEDFVMDFVNDETRNLRHVKISPELRELLNSMLHKDPAERISLSEIS